MFGGPRTWPTLKGFWANNPRQLNNNQGRTPVAWGGREHAVTRVDGRAPKQATRNGLGKATGLNVNKRFKNSNRERARGYPVGGHYLTRLNVVVVENP